MATHNSLNERIDAEAVDFYADHKAKAENFVQAKSDADYYSGQVRLAAWEAAGAPQALAEENLKRAEKIGQNIVPALIEQGKAKRGLQDNSDQARKHFEFWQESYVANAIGDARADGYEPNLAPDGQVDVVTHVRKVD